MKRRVRIREAHDLEFLGWILLLFLGLLLAWASRAAALPDNRAWEQVSPPDKNGGEVRGIDEIAEGGVLQASEDGNKITYTSFSSFADPEGAPFGSQYLSTRGEREWKTQNISTKTTQNEYAIINVGGQYQTFSGDLTQSLLLKGQLGEIPGELKGYEDFRIRNIQAGQVTPLITSTPLGAGGEPLTTGLNLRLISASSDLKHVLFQSAAALTPNARYSEEASYNDYDWSDGKLEVVNVLPGAPHNESTPNPSTLEEKEHEMSSDGSTVFWRSNAVGTQESLYVRENVGQPPSPLDGEGKCIVPADACSVQMDASQVAGVKSGNGQYQGASSDGSRAFFIDNRSLTKESNSPPGEISSNDDLYEFNVPTNELHDLTTDRLANGEPNPEDPGGASVQGVLGIGDDGSYVYFVANGVLTHVPNARGESATHGTCEAHLNTNAEHCNVYLDHEGTITFITKLTPDDDYAGGGVADWDSNRLEERTSRVSPDGEGLVFMAGENLTGYENDGATEVYRYDATGNSLDCVSCNPSGAAPLGGAKIPAGTAFEITNSIYESRVLSADSTRVFFDSNDALVPQDTNHRQDVYEWEEADAGSCTPASAGFSASSGGCVSLISGGTYNADSTFVDASLSGGDVFFLTGQQLVPQDTDELTDLYDARENGGIPVPPAPPVCSGTGCQGVPPAPPIFATPSTATFSGEGNLQPPAAAKAKAKPKAKAKAKACRKGQVRSKRGVCVTRSRAKRASRGGRR